MNNRKTRKSRNGSTSGSWQGETYLATGPTGEPVFLHVLRPLTDDELSRSSRMQALINAVRDFTHPNSTRMLGAAVNKGHLCLFMERLLVVEPFSVHIKSGLRFPLAQVLEWVRQLEEVCRAAHAVGLVHGELTASALILTPGKQIKVVGMGIAQLRDHDVGAELCSRPADARFSPEDDLRAIEQLTARLVRNAIGGGRGSVSS